MVRRVIRRRRPNGRHHAQRRVADASPVFVDRWQRPRRSRCWAASPGPHLSRATDRPIITHGIQSGDVSVDSAIVWARADRAARMLVEVATTDSFKTIHGAAFVDALPETDFTAKALIEGLPPGQDIFYRIRFQDHSSPTILGEPQVGRFRTAPSERRSVSFVWSGDTAGRGASTNRGRHAHLCDHGAFAGPISSSIAATTSMPTARSRRS